MKIICAECGKPTATAFRSGLVPKQVCGPCYEKLAAFAVEQACNPRETSLLQKVGVTTETIAAAVKETYSE